MTNRMIARGRHISTAALIWGSAVLLGVADGFAAASVHATTQAPRSASLALAIAAGFLLGTALLRGLGSLVARVRIRQALAGHEASAEDHLTSEASRGIAQIEAFLADQHSRGA